jgi:cellulose biosynthesis protein BcsQ
MYFMDDIQGIASGGKPEMDVLLITDEWAEYAANITAVPVLIMTDSSDAIEVAGVKAVGRYQKGSIIYKRIKETYLTGTNVVYGFKDGGVADVSCFTGAAGGVGVTTVAVAYARRLAESGARVFYLDLNVNPSIDLYFENRHEGDMGNVLLALTSGSKNMRIIENYIQKDISGVDSFAPSSSLFDLNDITAELAEQLTGLITGMGAYDEVVIDMSNNMTDMAIGVLRLSDRVIVVSDGSKSANLKNVRMMDVLRESARIEGSEMERKWKLLYNRFSSKTGELIQNETVKNIGGINRIEYASEQDVEREVRKNPVLDRIGGMKYGV